MPYRYKKPKTLEQQNKEEEDRLFIKATREFERTVKNKMKENGLRDVEYFREFISSRGEGSTSGIPVDNEMALRVLDDIIKTHKEELTN